MKYSYKTLFRELEPILPSKTSKTITKWAYAFDFDDYNEGLIDFKPQTAIIQYNNFGIEFHFTDENSEQKWSECQIGDEWDYINIYDTEEECIIEYNNAVWTKIKEIEGRIHYLAGIKEVYKHKFINSDYLMEKLRRGE